MDWTSASDSFLEHHLPGTSRAATNLRSAVVALNSGFNRGLIRGVRLQGESGSGKNHLCRIIAAHRQWLTTGADPDRVEPLSTLLQGGFAEISLQALPDPLIESELFGYVKGAFTGADRDKPGLLGGSASDILLDEVGDASPSVQVKLLGVLESRQFRRVGASAEQLEETNARFLFATHHSLADLVREGKFREDLYWRTSEVVIQVPALRDQLDNLAALVEYQLRDLYQLAGYDSEPGALRKPPKLDAADLRWAASYAWPGNLRQLRHGLVRWLAVEGQVPFARAVLESEAEEPFRFTSRSQGSAVYMEDLKIRLEQARNAGVAIAGTLGELVDEVRRGAEEAIVAWHDAIRPSAEELNTLFPNARRNSISSKLSQWRKK